MKFTKHLLLVFAVIALVACQKDESPTTNNTPVNQNPNYEDPQLSGNLVTADFDGRVTDTEGQAIENALIEIGNKSTTTDDYGYYRIENAQVDKKFALIRVRRGNKFKQFRNFIPHTDRINRQDIVMIHRNVAGVYETADGGEVSLPDGAKATFMPGELVQEDGSPYSGQVIIAAAYLNPTDPSIGSYLPGSLAAVNEEGEQQALITYGMLGVELLTGSGAPLQLAEGQTAELEFPIQTEQSTTAPESIPLWFFDEISGIWREDGLATKVGDRYIGEVSHFTFWNCDISSSAAFIQGTVNYSNSGNPVQYAMVKATLSDGSYAYANLNNLGEFNGFVPAGEVVNLSCQLSNDCEVLSLPMGAVGPFIISDQIDLGVFEIQEPESEVDLVEVLATLVDCEGESLDGYFISYITSIGSSGYYSSLEAGEFNSTFASCTGDFELTIVAFEWENPETLYSADVIVPVEIDSLDLGEIVICDEIIIEDDEFFTYEDDNNSFVYGDSYSMTMNYACYTIGGSELPAPYMLLVSTSFPVDGESELCGSLQFIRFINADNQLVDVSLNEDVIFQIDNWVIGEENSEGPGFTDLYLASGSYSGTAYVTVYEGPEESENIYETYTSTVSGEFVHELSE